MRRSPLMLAVRACSVAVLVGLMACGGSDITPPLEPRPNPAPTTPAPPAMTVLGRGDVAPQRITAEVAVRGITAYTVATEHAGGSLVVYGLADPRRRTLLSRFTSANTADREGRARSVICG